MIITLNDTTASAVAAAISKARRNLGAASGLVLTLVVVCEAKHYQEALEASLTASREHPSRVLVVVRGTGRKSKLDAEIRTGEGNPGDVITLRMSGELVAHEESVVLPLLLPDLPVVVWWPNTSPDQPASDPVGALASRRITDASGARQPLAALTVRAKHHAAGDTDLTWTRLTQWRALLAAALDQFPSKIDAAVVEASRTNAPAHLMAAWLEARLGCPVEVKNSKGPGITAIRLVTVAGDISVERTDGVTATYAVPGQPRRSVALKRRTQNELLTEELRRMDADDIFNEACEMLLKRDARATRQSNARQVAAARKAAEKTPTQRKEDKIARVAPDETPAKPTKAAAKKAAKKAEKPETEA